MPRPAPRTITFTIDGLEVQAPENSMLVDAAKRGDIEIPVFCYEPKLGNPVGACRMCLVEIEGIPKLQTGCSTPVKDGMVVHTQSERVKTAQNSVVEFLLINHPLDCPVCDKGGECPLQDITFGWGRGFSRYVDPKRHFVKPLALSPLIAIDRERCILCYRCVRFSQEISEDHQLVLQERGAHSYVSTFDGHPYVAPFSGNIVELCPVGALTSQPYRFRARPWDIEDAGSVCTLCPSQCNVTLTVRDERVLRVLSRQNPEVDDGWLCDRGRFAYPVLGGDARVTAPLVRDGGELRPVSWERALEEAAAGLRRAGERVGALAGGGATNEEGLLLARLVREVLGSPHLDSRVAGALPLELLRALAEPGLQATVSDLEFAHAVLLLDCEPIADAAILDLRLRKGVRRHGLRLVPAGREQLLDESARDGAARHAARRRRGGRRAVARALGRRRRRRAGRAGAARPRRHAGARRIDGAGLLEVPAHANGRGLREAGVLPNAGPELGELDEDGPRRARDRRGAGRRRALRALPAGRRPARGPIALPSSEHLRSPWAEPELWEQALERASTVIAHATFLTEGVRAHANVVFPALAYAEKEGTIVHPDGRVQRLRPGVARPGETRDERRVLDELATLLTPVAVAS